jgi:hypothetical protein
MGNSFSHRKVKGVDLSQGPAKKRKGVDVSQGPAKKRKGDDVMPIHGVTNTPSLSGETAPSISRQGNNVVNPLAFIMELVLHKSFSWAFHRYMLKFDISL